LVPFTCWTPATSSSLSTFNFNLDLPSLFSTTVNFLIIPC
jgi:hypothetical protein